MIIETHFTPNIIFKLHNFTTKITNHIDNTTHAGTEIIVSSKLATYLLRSFREHAIKATNI